MKSLQKVLDIIDKVAETRRAGIRELSSMTGFPPATVHRIVSTLVQRRYFDQDPVTKKYSLSLRFLELGSRVQQQFNLTAIARPHLERLMAETKESVNLAVRDGDEIIYLDHVRSDYSLLQLFTRPGVRVPLNATGVGKVFLSKMSNPDLNSCLERTQPKPRTPYTLTDKIGIREELSRIRTKGFSIDNEEFEMGVRCVAAPVFDHSGELVAAISISGAAVRISQEKIDHFGKLVKRCSLAVSRELGFDGTNEIFINQEKGD